jgi:hypothetical protein
MQNPKLFIGSSSEELSLARRAKDFLSPQFDVTIWEEKAVDRAVFRINQNFFFELLTASLKFDFGLLIGTADDKVVVRGKEVMAPRDNILFELGLFTGRLGVNNCAFLVDKNINVFSDMTGVSLVTFDREDPATVDQALAQIRDFFLHHQQPEVNFFPSTTLASVYFENFLRPVCSYILSNNGFTMEEKQYRSCVINIIIPDKITADVNEQFERLKKRFRTRQASFQYKGRPRNVTIDVREDTEQLEIVDFPTVIAGINHAIGHLLPEDFNQNSRDYEAILARELKRFCDTILLLCKREDYNELICLKWEAEVK